MDNKRFLFKGILPLKSPHENVTKINDISQKIGKTQIICQI